MTQPQSDPHARPNALSAREWATTLAFYREPNQLRSSFELGVSLVPFVGLWALAWWSLSVSYWVAFGLSVVNAAFLLRLFAIQHDCGHGSFFKKRAVSDWVGRAIGVITLTPYDVWRRTHSIHHSSSGNLAQRGIGDIATLTVTEYNDRSPLSRFIYRLYRHPITLFGLAPGYLFFLQNRLPYGMMGSLKFWLSAMGTNFAIILALTVIWYFGGFMPILLVFLPSTLLAASAGVWLFYVQHQFENTQWSPHETWQVHEAALHGSSHYIMPMVLQWLSANIGIHHVHHLYSRIPFYRLPEVIRDHGYLAETNRITIRESIACAQLHLWDENSKQLLSFSQARKL